MLDILLIALGGAVGSACRYLLSTSIYSLLGRVLFPYGTLAVNVLGSFIMGLLAMLLITRFIDWNEQLRALLLIGLLGGFTTFSAFSYETVMLFESGELLRGALNIIYSVIFCLGGTWLGILLGRQL